MDFKTWLLSEMLVHKMGKKSDMVIAFRSHIWLVDSNDSGDIRIKRIYNAIRKEIPTLGKREFSDINDLAMFLRETIYDVLVGWYRDDVLYLDYEDMRNPKTSPLIKKVADALKVKNVSTDVEYNYEKPGRYGQSSYDTDEIRKEIPRKKLLGRLPKVMFHGTSSRYLDNIMRLGLRPGESESNYPRVIWHPDRVFLASWQIGAVGHAQNAAQRTKGVPVIVGFEIPDPAKIEPDYDVDTMSMTGQKTYDGKNTSGSYFSVTPEKATKQSGLVADQGRIPANFIRTISMRLPNGWRRFDVEKFKKALTRMSVSDILDRYGAEY